MLKFLIISLLSIYIFARFAGFFFRMIYWLSGKEYPPTFQPKKEKQTDYQTRKWKGMDMFIPKKKSKKDFEEGEFVDFEEVKD